jgi:chromosome segregation ATPase
MSTRAIVPASLLALVATGVLFSAVPLVHSQPQKKEYLSELEADKIRDAETQNERIKLFLSFATDRLQKLNYELGRKAPEVHRTEMLNGLLNGYSGCVDDAADLITLGVEKQQEIRAGIKEMRSKTKEFLETLGKFQKEGPEIDKYKESLDDAIESTKDAQADAEKAAKEIAPPPTRKKP